MALCLRCDWSGDGPGTCPRCGADLWQTAPGAPRRAPTGAAPERPGTELEAEVVSRNPPPVRRRRPGWMAVATIGLVIALLALARPGDRMPAPQESSGPGAGPAPRLARALALPAGLSDATAEAPRDITFVSVDVTDGGTPLHRLWRLSLPSGELVPGPAIGRVERLRAAPEVDRIAFLDEAGALFVLDGFLGRRPTWIAGGVEDFDVSPDGHVVMADVVRRTAPGGGSTETLVRIQQLEPGSLRPDDPFVRRLRGFLPREVVVRGGRVYAWGIRRGRPVLLSLPPGPIEGRPRPVPLPTLSVIDVSPSGVVAARAGNVETMILSPASRRRPLVVPIRAERSLGWSPGGRLAVVGNAIGGPNELIMVGASTLQLELPEGPSPLHGHLAFSPDDALAVLGSQEALTVIRIDTGASWTVPLPPGLPGPLGPVAIR